MAHEQIAHSDGWMPTAASLEFAFEARVSVNPPLVVGQSSQAIMRFYRVL